MQFTRPCRPANSIAGGGKARCTMSSTTVVPDLMSVIHRQITPETVRAIASQLGEDRERTAAAVSTGIPSVLAALSDVARSRDRRRLPEGDRRREARPSRTPVEGAAILLDATAGNGNAHEASLLDDELGQRSWTISDAVAQSSGIRRESAHRLLGGVASVAVLAVADSAGNLSAGGLRSFLNSQRREWMSRLPQLDRVGVRDAAGRRWPPRPRRAAPRAAGVRAAAAQPRLGAAGSAGAGGPAVHSVACAARAAAPSTPQRRLRTASRMAVTRLAPTLRRSRRQSPPASLRAARRAAPRRRPRATRW